MQQSAIAARLHNPDYVNCLRQCEFDRLTSESAPSGRLATLNSLQRPTASRPVREFRTSGVQCVVLSTYFNLFLSNSVCLFIDCRKSERVASLSSTAAGLLRDFFKPSSGALNFKKSLRRQGIGYRRYLFRPFASAHWMSSVLRKTTAPYVAVHFLNVVRERLVPPRFTGLSAREARLATPYGQDRHGLHYAPAPLRPHQTCRKRGKASPCIV